MKRTLIFYDPEYADLAIKLRDNYRAHGHEETDIVSVEEHDDIEYAEKMMYEEAVFIEDRDTVTFHDTKSGYTERRPVSDVLYNDSSRFISLILRHKPESIGITLDEHGWANVDELIEGISRTQYFDREMLEEIVRTDEKKRYSFNEDRTLIRANQGHSIPVDVELEKTEPPKYLYHGTGEKYRESIDQQGLIPKSRLYVHLSADIETAEKVGSRHGKPVVYRVSSGLMHKNGFDFYKSVNGVWLTAKVPTQYIKRKTFDEKEIEEVVGKINKILLNTELDSDTSDTSRAQVIFKKLEGKYSWEVLQQALFTILLDDSRDEDAWYQMACVFWSAILESDSRKREGLPELKFRKKTILALLYYRLRKSENEIADNLLWSITCDLYHLDYCLSMYEPEKDEKIIRKLAEYGRSF